MAREEELGRDAIPRRSTLSGPSPIAFFFDKEEGDEDVVGKNAEAAIEAAMVEIRDLIKLAY